MAREFKILNQLRQASDYVNARSLSASTAERVTIPAGYNFVVFSATANYYVLVGDSNVTAAVPGDTTDGTASELNPLSYLVNQEGTETHISVISPDSCVITLAFYKAV